MFFCPDGFPPNSGLTGPNNTIYIYIYVCVCMCVCVRLCVCVCVYYMPLFVTLGFMQPPIVGHSDDHPPPRLQKKESLMINMVDFVSKSGGYLYVFQRLCVIS